MQVSNNNLTPSQKFCLSMIGQDEDQRQHESRLETQARDFPKGR